MPHKDPEDQKRYSREYYLKNKERILDYNKEHYIKNKDRILSLRKKNYPKVKDKDIERKKKYRKEKRDWVVKSDLNKMKRQVETGSRSAIYAVSRLVDKGELKRLSEEFVPCVDCGERAFHYEHRDYNKETEVEPVCRRCNHRRGPAIYRTNQEGQL